jgi:hypothetical protein
LLRTCLTSLVWRWFFKEFYFQTLNLTAAMWIDHRFAAAGRAGLKERIIPCHVHSLWLRMNFTGLWIMAVTRQRLRPVIQDGKLSRNQGGLNFLRWRFTSMSSFSFLFYWHWLDRWSANSQEKGRENTWVLRT